MMLSGKLCFSTAFTAFGISTSVPMSIPLQRWLIWVPGTYGSMCFALFGAFQVHFGPSHDHGLCALCTWTARFSLWHTVIGCGMCCKTVSCISTKAFANLADMAAGLPAVLGG